jgi:hypothetical protein
MEEREFFKRIERFRREYEGVLEEEEIERCVYEALRDHAAYKAYVCASEILVRKKRKEKPAAQRPQQPAVAAPAAPPVAAAPPAPPSEAKELGKKRRFSIGRRPKKAEEKAAEEGMEPQAAAVRRISLRELPWQAYAGLASLALSAAHPLLALVSLPIIALLSRRRNTVPFWVEGDAVVWPGVGRFRFYRVERVFKDVGGMGAEFSNYLISTLHEFNGVYYDRGQAWILLEEGADVEAARTVLRRFGVVVEPRPSPPPVQLPRERASRYLPWALLPLLAFAAGPAAGAAALLPALLIAVLTARDLGHRPAPPMRALTSNASYYSVPDNDAVLSVALAAQPLVESALVIWKADPHYAVKLERRGGWAERLAWWTQSQWRLQALEVIQIARQRLFNLHEKGFVVNGLLNGRVATFAAGRPVGSIDAFTRDLAAFSPWALLMSPSQCREGSVVIGADDAGRTVCINPEELQTPHVMVLGKTGAGKTTLGLSMAVQLRRRGVVPAVVDPHGHWAQLARWFPDTQIVDARRLAPPLVLKDDDDVDVLLDALRAAGIQIFDAHFTVMMEALGRAARDGDTSLDNVLRHLYELRADPSYAFAVDAVYGRLASIAKMRQAKIDLAKPVVVHAEGDTTPSACMKLALWITYFAVAAKAACPKPPCKPRMFLAVDEGHVLLKNMEALAKAWREVRKFGVEAAVFTQSVADIPRDIVENSGVKFVLAIEPEAVPETAARLHIDASRLQRVAYEGLPEERVGLVRVEARSPVFVRIAPPPPPPAEAAKPALKA